MLLTRHEPHGKKPNSKRFSCAFKQCPRCNRDLSPTMSAVQITSRCDPWFTFRSATRTLETLWPPNPYEILPATRFVRKPGIELLERTWVVSPGLWVIRFIHPHILYLVATCVKWIATLGEVAIHFAQVPSTSCGRHHLFPLRVFGKRAEVPRPLVASSGKKVIHVSERSGD